MVKKILKNTMKILNILLLIFALLAIAFAVYYHLYSNEFAKEKSVIIKDKETSAYYYVDEKWFNPYKYFRGLNIINNYITKNYNNADNDFLIRLVDNGIDPNNYYRFSSLLYAIQEQDKNEVQKLIDEGTDVNKTFNDGGTIVYKPLRWALQTSTCDIVELLYAHGATLEGDTSERYYRHILKYCINK